MSKTKIVLLHAAYWLCYGLLLSFGALALSGISQLTNGPDGVWVSFLTFSFGLGAGIPAFYLGHGPAFSQGLAKGSNLKLVAWCLVGIVGGGLFGYSFATLHKGLATFVNDIELLFWVAIIFGVPNSLLGLGMRAFVDWFQARKDREELTVRNHEMEMSLLKSQLNPHFLFNTLSNIDVLIGKDPDKASDYLQKLSDILRFMLYETDAERLPLAREIEYIERYIALQKIRFAQLEAVQYRVEGSAASHNLPPLLFIPFIENAFKYGETQKLNPHIAIRFKLAKDQIVFECENRYHATGSQSQGGLGSELIQRRLNLLFPGRHVLETQDKDGLYRVKLVLSLA